MSLEGLKIILEKEEVVVTFQAKDFIDRPKDISDAYKMHLRTYIPMHSGASDDYLSVDSYTKRLIQLIENAKALRGYITADFGYGKTSTGLYVWERAIEAGILTVPPFQLNSLNDFIYATYGWVSYMIDQVQPSLLPKLREIYRLYNTLSIQIAASRYGIEESKVSLIVQDRPQILELTPQDATNFFRETTQLVLEAGFKGLLVIADEVQQYLEPEIKSGKSDPVGPLFNLIQGLGSQINLPFGLILIIPSKELGVINDQRGDLIDRLRSNALDLKTLYDRGFPIRLWNHLAKTFNFDTYSGNIIRSETLYSLGQIAVRNDLANGPRTVVNAFRCAIKWYLTNNIPYSPINLIMDFLGGENAFDGTKRIQEVVGRALDHNFIRSDESLRQAICLAAAFPIDGASVTIQNAFKLSTSFTKLRENLFGEVVLEVGDKTNPGTTLCGLEAEEEQADWLLLSIRDFVRNYHENSSLIKNRALLGFIALLKTNIFKNDWKVLDETENGLISSAGIIFEGAFASFRKEFPGRVVHVIIVFDDEPVRLISDEYDAAIQFSIRRYLELDDQSRQELIKPPILDEKSYCAGVDLNFMRHPTASFNRAVENLLTKVVAPEQITPLFALSMYGYFLSLNENGRVPKTEQPLLTMQFMPSLLDGVINIILDKSIGETYDASGSRLIEKLILLLLRSRYGSEYHTLMVINTWRSSIRDYINMLTRLPTPLHRQGYLSIQGTKDSIAKQLNLTNTSFDNYLNTFPDLIELIGDFRKAKIGEVRFKVHPLEEKIKEWVTNSPQLIKLNEKNIHALSQEMIIKQAKQMGYTLPEVEQTIQLLVEREWGSIEGNYICEIPSLNIKQQDVIDEANKLIQKVKFGREIFPDAIDMMQIEEESKTFYTLAIQTKTDNSKLFELLFTQIEIHLKGIDEIIQHHKGDLETKLTRLEEKYKRLSLPFLPPKSIFINETSYSDLFDQHYENFRVDSSKIQEQLNFTSHLIGESKKLLASKLTSDEDLKKIYLNLLKIDEDYPNLEDHIDKLSKQIKGYSSWDDVFRLRRDVSSKIGLLKINDSIKQQLLDLGKTIDDILAIKSHDSLLKASFFEPKIRKFLEYIQQESERAGQRFDIIQNRYKIALQSINNLSDNTLSQVVFSPLEPDRVYEQFYNLVRNNLLVILDITDNQIQQLCSQLRQMAVNKNSFDTQSTMVKNIEENLATLSGNLPYSRLNNLEFIKDEGEFSKVLLEIKEIQENIAPYRKQISELYEQADLSMDESTFINHIDFDKIVNLVNFLNEEQLSSDNATWKTIRSLWENSWIQIEIKRLPRKNI